MVLLTRWFGVTETDADRSPAREKADIEEIVEKSLLMQSNAAAQQHRPVCRGTHAKGVCARAQFEVLDVTAERPPALASRLAKGIFANPGVYSAVARFANADASINSDFKPDVRSLSFSVDFARNGMTVPAWKPCRQDFSMQNATTLPINDSPAFLATMKPDPRSVVAAIQGHASSGKNARVGRKAGSPDNHALPAIALLEHRPVPSRTERCREVFGHTVHGQSGAPTAKEQPEGTARRADPALDGRQKDERIRRRCSVSRRRQDDILGQAPGCQFLDRKRQHRME